jgi:tRNA threonylcarbamoyladenosine biosynthesis protein TsaE
MQKSTTNSVSQTKKLGENLAKKILRQKPEKTAVVLGLEGELGAGKTTFLQGFAKGLGIRGKILSPTFVIVKKFQIPNYKLQINPKLKIQNPKFLYFYHIDCYRLHRPKEVLDLGFKEIIKNPENITAIEWSEKISKILPRKIISIQFDHDAENQRTLTIN